MSFIHAETEFFPEGVWAVYFLKGKVLKEINYPDS